ncbi:chitin-binding domain protein cbd-1-like [Trichoplusia ni]|uniref:Chitin-binding domain protein cbd-1-like n=1 Tax=Trichoplusia ni TaxID=7111 RepID=A0A7E5W4L6_TRINI|nr:chitin-binding domain protein cbd-1-like [Trichoplusia ni]
MNKLLVLCVIVGGVFADPALFEDRQLERKLPSCRGQKEAGEQACAEVAGRLAPHPTECRLFFYCTRFRAICHRCPFGLHFNPTLSVCDWPKNAGCAANTTTTAAPSEPPATSEDPSTTDSSPASPSDEPSSPTVAGTSEPSSSEPPAVTESV